MTIIYKQGNMFNEHAEAIVNTVNCVGVMGKGVALEFKKRWPENFKEYKKLCDQNQLSPGKMFIYDNADMLVSEYPRYLINFPTKKHWRSKSRIDYIIDGLKDFAEQIQKLDVKSVAIPPLGCGNGGLSWDEVRVLMEQYLSHIDDINFIVFAPKSAETSPEHTNLPKAKMTKPRATLMKAIGEFEDYFGGALTKVSLQKVVYFLQELGVEFGVTFSKAQRGPYSQELGKIFGVLEEKNFIVGYSDKDPQIKVTKSAYTVAEEFLASNNYEETLSLVKKLGMLIEGYESPYGMELLSSVHYLANVEGATEVREIVDGIQNWNDHKNGQFTKNAIELAFERLYEDGFIRC